MKKLGDLTKEEGKQALTLYENKMMSIKNMIHGGVKYVKNIKGYI